MDDVELFDESKENTINEYTLDINKIIEQKINEIPILELMRNQVLIINFIKQNINCFLNICKDSQLNIVSLLQYLEWICNSLKKICKDTDTPILIHKHYYKNFNIARSSYHFCKKSHECKRNKECKNHHFVYHLLFADVFALYEYIKYSTTFNMSEILRSLKTINYVTEHMMNELSKRMC